MKINGHRTHFGERPRDGGVLRSVSPLAARLSPSPDVEVVWYPHKDAASLLPADGVPSHENHLLSRGSLALRSPLVPAWS